MRRRGSGASNLARGTASSDGRIRQIQRSRLEEILRRARRAKEFVQARFRFKIENFVQPAAAEVAIDQQD